MKINILVPNLALTGGNRIALEHAEQLRNMGHEVVVAYPIVPYKDWWRENTILELLIRTLKLLRNVLLPPNVSWAKISVKIIKPIIISNAFIPDADITMATTWQTAKSMLELSSSKGTKVYLIHHRETDIGKPELVDATYSYPFYRIAVSAATATVLNDELNIMVNDVVLNGYDPKIFFPDRSRNDDGKIVLAYYSELKRKGSDNIINAFKDIKEALTDVELWAYGKIKPKKLPKYVKYFRNPSDTQLRRLYSNCDVFMYGSTYEGFALPPMEAMVCGAATVMTNVGAASEYSIPGKTMLIANPAISHDLGQNVIKLIKDDAAREKLSQAGRDHIRQYSIEKSTNDLSNIFQKIMGKKHDGQ